MRLFSTAHAATRLGFYVFPMLIFSATASFGSTEISLGRHLDCIVVASNTSILLTTARNSGNDISFTEVENAETTLFKLANDFGARIGRLPKDESDQWLVKLGDAQKMGLNGLITMVKKRGEDDALEVFLSRASECKAIFSEHVKE